MYLRVLAEAQLIGNTTLIVRYGNNSWKIITKPHYYNTVPVDQRRLDGTEGAQKTAMLYRCTPQSL